TVQFPIRGEHEGATLRTEDGGDSKTGGACDKKVPGNLELGVVVVSEGALDELLDRALLGLAADRGRAGRWLGPRLSLVLPVVPGMRGPPVLAGLARFLVGAMGEPMGPVAEDSAPVSVSV